MDPALLGFSLINIKDAAFAFVYSRGSHALASVWHQRRPVAASGEHREGRHQASFPACMAGLLVFT
jgi:hypothetical protein